MPGLSSVSEEISGFTQWQFKKLDGLYLLAASRKTLIERSVECDFDEPAAYYTYYKKIGDTPFLQFVIRKVGPKSKMYEIYKQGKGRIAKSGVFDIAFERLQDEILGL
jgi:hypothetical protein